MNFGVQLYPWERWPDMASMGELTRTAESLGFASVVLSEHMVTPLTGESHPIGSVWPEIYVLSAYLAGSTSTIRFVFNATVVPLRHPIHQANEIATLDQVSNGRLSIVTGIGWHEAEFEALGIPFRNRGPRTEEYLRAMQLLLTQEEVEFHGEYVSFDKVTLKPQCVQQPHVPILIGGVGKHARRRIAEIGDGWGAPTPWPIERLEREVIKIKEEVAAVGRDPETLVFSAGLTFGEPDAASFEAFTHIGSQGELSATASADETITEVQRFRDAGFTDLMVSTDWATPAEYADKLAWFSENVIDAI